MEDSPIGLDKWLVGMWLVVSAKNGISSYELSRALGITQKSAWFLGHRIRFALQNETLEKLSGEVEADETYIGGRVRYMHADRKRKRGRDTGGVGNPTHAARFQANGLWTSKLGDDEDIEHQAPTGTEHFPYRPVY